MFRKNETKPPRKEGEAWWRLLGRGKQKMGKNVLRVGKRDRDWEKGKASATGPPRVDMRSTAGARG